MDSSLILNILILIVGTIGGLFFKNFFPKYFEEKGKNLATKEDIGEITTIIESIKTQLTHDTEVLKAGLSLKNQNLYSIKAEERKSLIDYHTKYSVWLGSIMNSGLTEYDLDNYSEMKNIGKNIDERKMNYELAEGLLTLFMHDDEFMELKGKLVIETINLTSITNKYCHKLKVCFTQYKFAINSVPINEQVEIYRKMHDENIKILDDFSKEQLEKYTHVVAQWSKMTKMVKERIEKVIT